MPNGPPLGLATLPVGAPKYATPGYVNENDYSDETARPIGRRVQRDKQSQDIIAVEQDNVPQRQVSQRLPRRANSLVEQDAEERQQTVGEYQDQSKDPRDGRITGFEALNLPFVTGPIGLKPKRQVFFEIPGGGKHSARFHDIIEAEYLIALVYDTRFEEGSQYLPPDMSDEPEKSIKLSIPTANKTFKTYEVASHGLTFPLGVFDIVVLAKRNVEVDKPDYTE